MTLLPSFLLLRYEMISSEYTVCLFRTCSALLSNAIFYSLIIILLSTCLKSFVFSILFDLTLFENVENRRDV